MTKITHHIGGEHIDSHTRLQTTFNPATGKELNQVTMGSINEVEQAVTCARAALQTWQNTSPLKRARILFRYNTLLNDNKETLAQLISQEHGKVFSDALGEVQRGIEVVEFACGIPHLLKGEYSAQVATDVDSYSMRQPVGICAGITPFNFPFMVPMWMFPIAIACGNTFILKPSERDPAVTMKMIELLYEAGLPNGVVNLVHGDKAVVDAILTHPDIAAISFVGSTPIAKYIYETAAKHGKRVNALGGAKNHCVVMPDADVNEAVKGLMGAAYGSAGERCMAISVAVVVGKEQADAVISALASEIDQLKIGPFDDQSADMGPVITQSHRERIIRIIDSAEAEKAILVRDGRKFTLKGSEEGYFIGPTLLDHVTPNMTAYQEEIFGPVLCVVRAGSLQEAIALINNNPYANGTSIYTKDGASARKFTTEIHVGMVGVNIPIPVPMAFHSFGGWKHSLFGDTHMHGMEGIKFYTRLKTITTKWQSTQLTNDNHFLMPTLQ